MAEAILAAKTSGVYAIVNLSNGKRYIGSSIDVAKRWRVHRNDLKIGKHHSVKLQRAFAKYGAENFDFQILECVAERSLLAEREQYWINLHQSSTRNGYNACPVAGNCSGLKASESAKQNMREAWVRKRLEKPAEHFEALAQRRRQSVATFDAKNRELRIAYFRERRLLKKEEIAKKKSDMYRKNRTVLLEKSKAYYLANRQEKIQYAKDRRELKNGNAKEATESC